MNEFPRWKYALVAVALFFGFLYALPNLFPKNRPCKFRPPRFHG